MENKIIGFVLIVGAIALVVAGTAIGEIKGHRLIGTGISSLLVLSCMSQAKESKTTQQTLGE